MKEYTLKKCFFQNVRPDGFLPLLDGSDIAFKKG